MKCEFCADPTKTACKTCDVPLCKWHARVEWQGECKECFDERRLCSDCRYAPAEAFDLCLACDTLPVTQTKICAFPECSVCRRRVTETMQSCCMCKEMHCKNCREECNDCDDIFCEGCDSLKQCVLCLVQRDNDLRSAFDEFQLESIRPCPKRCYRCQYYHKWTHDSCLLVYSSSSESSERDPDDGSSESD